ncbi:regulatory protein RecX [Desulfurobacterium sp.]
MSSKFKEALSYALRLLCRRDYSEKEILNKLTDRFPAVDSEKVVAHLKENGYLSDYRTGFNYAISKMEKGWGRRKIRFYMIQKGIPEETADRILREIEFDYSFIKKILKKRFGDNLKTEKQKATRFLQQRGFSYTEIYNLISGKI